MARQHGDRELLLVTLLQTAKTSRGTAAYAEADAFATDGTALAKYPGDEAPRSEFLIVRGTVGRPARRCDEFFGSRRDRRKARP